jgi:hypothetical protein
VIETDRVDLEREPVLSLAWVGDSLVDVASGWQVLPLDGTVREPRRSGFGLGLNSITVAPRGDVVALVESTGTKGLLLDATSQRIVREIDRIDDGDARAYRYPIALFTLPTGRTGMVHCPTVYNRLEIEDAITGETIGPVSARKPTDFFHSRLAVSPDGRRLLSAGWVWHPWSCLAVYDLHAALADPTRLDTDGDIHGANRLLRADVGGACFLPDGFAVSTTSERQDCDGPDGLGPNVLARRSITEDRYLWTAQLAEPAGDLLVVAGAILALRGHPRLYDPADGSLLAEWPDLPTGEADSSIVWDRSFSGPVRVAVHPSQPRFAVTDGRRVTVITLPAR